MTKIGFEKRAFVSFLSLALLAGLVFGGVKAIGRITNVVTKASIATAPQSIQLVNVTDTTASIFWQTQDATTGFISYGDTVDLGKTKLDDRDRDSGQAQAYRNHMVTFTKLTPKAKYYYAISANDQTYNRNGSPFLFFTSAQVPVPPASNLLTARVLNTDQTPAQDYFITLVFEDQGSGKLSSMLGAITGPDGQYSVDLANLRTADGTNPFLLTPNGVYTVDIVILDEFAKNYTQTVTYTPNQPFPTVYFGKTSLFDGPSSKPVSPLLLPQSNASSSGNFSSQFNSLIFGTPEGPASSSASTTVTATPAPTVSTTASPQRTISPKSRQLLF